MKPNTPRPEANRYDKIFKENLEAVTPALLEKILLIPVARLERLPVEVQRTLERKSDQLLRITDRQGDCFLVHLEFQTESEAQMADRMLEYRAMFRRKYRQSVRQFVIFLSDHAPSMPVRIEEPGLLFSYRLVWLAQYDYRLFLSSDNPDEVVFSVLGNLGDDDPQTAALRIITRLDETSSSQKELEKHLEQVRILANLRTIKPFVEKIMETISKFFKPEKDLLFQQGIERGIERGIEQGIEQVVRHMVVKGILSDSSIAELTGVPEDTVARIRHEQG